MLHRITNLYDFEKSRYVLQTCKPQITTSVTTKSDKDEHKKLNELESDWKAEQREIPFDADKPSADVPRAEPRTVNELDAKQEQICSLCRGSSLRVEGHKAFVTALRGLKDVRAENVQFFL